MLVGFLDKGFHEGGNILLVQFSAAASGSTQVNVQLQPSRTLSVMPPPRLLEPAYAACQLTKRRKCILARPFQKKAFAALPRSEWQYLQEGAVELGLL